MKNKKILFVNQSSGYLMIDIVNEFVATGYYKEVALIAGTVRPQGVELNQKVKVRKIIKYNKTTTLHRILSWLIGTIQIILLIRFFYRDFDVFVVSNPPTNAFLPVFCKNRYSTLIYDVYPNGLVSGGFVKKESLIYYWWSKANKIFFKKASNIYTITDGMAKVLSQYVDLSKIKVIPLWPSTGINQKIEKSKNLFITKHKLENKFIVMYSGNIGLGHNVDLLIDVAEKLKDEKEILFAIIGQGWAKDKLVKQKEVRNLSNVRFYDWQPANLLNHSLSAADIAYVSIEEVAAQICIPSKTYNLIKFNVPIISAAGKCSELNKIISKNGLGNCFEKDEKDKIASYILEMKSNPDLYNVIKSNLNKYAEEIENNAKVFVK